MSAGGDRERYAWRSDESLESECSKPDPQSQKCPHASLLLTPGSAAAWPLAMSCHHSDSPVAHSVPSPSRLRRWT